MLVQKGKIFSLEFIPQDSDRDKKLSGRFSDPMISSKPSTGNDTVHVDMIVQFLVPGVKDLDDPGCAPRYFRSADSSRRVWAQDLCSSP